MYEKLFCFPLQVVCFDFENLFIEIYFFSKKTRTCYKSLFFGSLLNKSSSISWALFNSFAECLLKNTTVLQAKIVKIASVIKAGIYSSLFSGNTIGSISLHPFGKHYVLL